MSKSRYLDYLKSRIEKIEARKNADLKRIGSGSLGEKVEAAGDLATMEGRLEETKQKLEQLEKESEGAWEDIKTEIEQNLDYFEEAFQRWIDNYHLVGKN